MREDKNSVSSSPEEEEEDVDKIRQREGEKRFQAMIDAMNPIVKNHPELYRQAASKLEHIKMGRIDSWGKSHLTGDFYSWLRIAGENEKPTLAITIALLACHDVIAPGKNTVFHQASQKRGFREWVNRELEALEAARMMKPPSKKKRKAIKTEAIEASIRLEAIRSNKDVVLPSIEKDPSTMNHKLPRLRPNDQRDSSSITDSSIGQETTEEPEPPVEVTAVKRRKVDHEPAKAKVMARSIGTQTDDSLLPSKEPTSTPISTETITTKFNEAIATQTESLRQVLHEHMQMMHRPTVGDENQHHKTQLVQSMPTRAIATELPSSRPAVMFLGQQTIMTPTITRYHAPAFEHERVRERNVTERHATVFEEMPAINLDHFRHVPQPAFKREFGF